MSDSPQILPDILLLEILSWLPAATVIRLRSLSTSLNSETRAPAFVLLHLSRLKHQQPEREGRPPRLLRYNNYGFSREQRRQPESQPPPRPGVPIELRRRALKSHCIAAAANGLLLVRRRSHGNSVTQPRMLVCNPLTGDCTRLPQQDAYAWWVGFVFAPGTGEYKVLTVLNHCFKKDRTDKFTFEVCTMPVCSGLPGPWKKIPGFSSPGTKLVGVNPHNAVVVNGRAYLVGSRYFCRPAELTTITSFDISDETIREVPVPPLSSSMRRYDATLANLGGSLSLLQVEKTGRYESRRHRLLVWVMKECGGDGQSSWMKAFFFEARLPLSTPIVEKKHKYCLSTVCLDEKGELVCYDAVERRYNPVRGGLGVEFGTFKLAAPFIGTLVAPKFLNGDHIN